MSTVTHEKDEQSKRNWDTYKGATGKGGSSRNYGDPKRREKQVQ